MKPRVAITSERFSSRRCGLPFPLPDDRKGEGIGCAKRGEMWNDLETVQGRTSVARDQGIARADSVLTADRTAAIGRERGAPHPETAPCSGRICRARYLFVEEAVQYVSIE